MLIISFAFILIGCTIDTDSIRHIILKIKDVWVEDYWTYTNVFKKRKLGDKKSLIITFELNKNGFFYQHKTPFVIGENNIQSIAASNSGVFKYKLKLPAYEDTLKIKFWGEEVKFTRI